MTIAILIKAILFPLISALFFVFFVHPLTVKVAHKYKLVDNPEARKLQKEPVPVIGGIAVFFGMMISVGVSSMFFNSHALMATMVVIMVMLYIGTTDDLVGLSPYIRLIAETGALLFIMYMDRMMIDNLHGLFGINFIPYYLAIPLSLIAGCGIINSINLIDGVDGLSSGFCIMAAIVFGICFGLSYNGRMLVLSAITVGALVPFFLHNVFGKKSKMFIGDGGTLIMGMIMTIFVFNTLKDRSFVAYNYPNCGVVAFTLAVLSGPVFDTIRVMTGRMIKGKSPFSPDKSHLHHLFIEIGFSHIGTSVAVITLSSLNILIWFLSYQFGADATGQFIVVFIMGIAQTFGFYYIVRRLNHSNLSYRILYKIGQFSHVETWKMFGFIRKIMDKI